ncbi:putative CENPB DNA-binding domain-containing protein 1 [Petaurus breviceps papuanus]|uniref:putative CENPB DNA-binding domain-containing protein 1 n=1 Tax=Petaurus breviceps papuanus TaxID=3040969 RepID=UPI0036DBCE19
MLGPKISAKRHLSESTSQSAKRDRKAINLHVKLEVLRRFAAGEKLSRIVKALGLSTSTVATIRDNKEKIRASSQAATPQVATKLTRSRSLVMENMERLLSVWIEDQSQRGVPVNVSTIQEKAKSLFQDLKQEQGPRAEAETFGASRGWFTRFKARHSLPHLGTSSESQHRHGSCSQVPRDTEDGHRGGRLHTTAGVQYGCDSALLETPAGQDLHFSRGENSVWV